VCPAVARYIGVGVRWLWLWRKEVQVWSLGLEYDARRVRVSTHSWESSPTRTLRAAHPQNNSNTPRCPSVVLWTPCSGVEWRVKDDVANVEWRVFEPAVNGCGEAARRVSSLRTWGLIGWRSPCPPCPTTYPPYVPRPSAVDRYMLQRLTCSRTATVVCRVSTSGETRLRGGGWRL
jgi:hypothetical protein